MWRSISRKQGAKKELGEFSRVLSKKKPTADDDVVRSQVKLIHVGRIKMMCKSFSR